MSLNGGIEVGAIAGSRIEVQGDKIVTRGVTPENGASPQQLQITRATFGESQIKVPDGLEIPSQGTARLLAPSRVTTPLISSSGNKQLLIGLGSG